MTKCALVVLVWSICVFYGQASMCMNYKELSNEDLKKIDDYVEINCAFDVKTYFHKILGMLENDNYAVFVDVMEILNHDNKIALFKFVSPQELVYIDETEDEENDRLEMYAGVTDTLLAIAIDKKIEPRKIKIIIDELKEIRLSKELLTFRIDEDHETILMKAIKQGNLEVIRYVAGEINSLGLLKEEVSKKYQGVTIETLVLNHANEDIKNYFTSLL